ncbi:hypothetical protein M3Y97_00135400 [Aphelenchoides bicaudatus]|nr:hypothetical protein M3Y97_00135400 [Aphelenchoides bicaudatus]
MFVRSIIAFAGICLFVARPAVSLNCFQQIYTPGLTNTVSNLIPGYNTQQQTAQQQQQYQQQQYAAQLNLPSITCSPTANSCFKFVCFNPTNSYTIKGCLDVAQPQYSCQAMDSQCLGGQGNCYVCSGNNCNGAMSIHGNPARLITISAVISIGIYLFKNLT